MKLKSSRTRRSTPIEKLAAALLCAIVAVAIAGETAQAEVQYQFSMGGNGGEGGQLGYPMGLGINNSTGHVYVAERSNNRISEFTETGQFVKTWGYDVVLEGEDDKPTPADEVQQLTVPAGSGNFKLAYQGSETPYIPYNAAAVDVQSALNALPTISSGGGSVTVTGGPGSLDASTPYRVAFDGGPLAGQNVESMSMRWSGLGQPVGTRLTCVGDPFFAFQQPEFFIQWLADGVPIPGETDNTYIPTAAVAGKAIQCEMTGRYGTDQRRTNPNFTVIDPASSTPIPEPPSEIPGLTTPLLKVGSPGGGKIKCEAGAWTGNPTSYTYEWFRDNKPVGTSASTAATFDEYTVTAQDLEKPSKFQCKVTAISAGGSAVMWSTAADTDPSPSSSNFEQSTVRTRSLPKGRVGTYVQGGPQLEVCKVKPPSDDICKPGVGGTAIGQLSEPSALTVDNSPGGNGDIWVVEQARGRVQKFTPSGTPILVIGYEVNESTTGNLCTVASGHACGAGPVLEHQFQQNRNLEPGSFANGWPEQPFGTGNPREVIDVDSAGNVFVAHDAANGDGHETDYSRIQKFGPNGEFIGQLRMPPSLPGLDSMPLSVGIDSQSRVITTTDFPEIDVFKQSEFTPEYTGPKFSERQSFATGSAQMAMAVDPKRDYIWAAHLNVINGQYPLHVCGEPGNVRSALLAWDIEGHKLECSTPTGPGELPSVSAAGVEGLVVSPNGMLFASVGSQGLVKAFKIPEPTEPEVVKPLVRGITTETAKLGARIKPGFLPTDITIEYGPEDCSTHMCTSIGAGKVYGLLEQFTDVTVEGLEPETRYHYRVIAENSEGTDTGPDRTFVTHTFVDLNADKCANVLVRKQTRTGALLDCRAYELASSAFSGGYDVVSDLAGDQQPLPLHPGAPGKLLYTVDGGIPGTGNPTNLGQDPYLAVRSEDGWTTRYVGIPSNSGISQKRFASTLADADGPLNTFAFGGPEICSPCFADGSSGLPVRLPDGTLVQGMQGSIAQTGAKPSGYVGRYLSAEGTHLVFGTTAQLEPGDTDGGLTIYERDLQSGTTEVVSTDATGNPLAGAAVGELDMSDDGSRMLVGQKVAEDTAGNTFWHPYLHTASSPTSVDLAPGTTSGVLFNGMTADGSRIFFTTADKLDPGDTDESADIYEASVGGGGLDLRIVSVGSSGPSNDDGCTPAGLPNSWNSPTGDGRCGALAFAGEAGLASESGTFYFLSPEQLDGSQGTLNQANLYVIEPDGPPKFVAMIDTNEGKPGPGHWTNALSDTDVTNSNLESPRALAVDQANGDIYTMEADSGKLARFDASGAPKAFPETGTNKLSGFTTSPEQRSEVAIDNSGGFADGLIYATRFQNRVDIFDRDGKKQGELDGSSAFLGTFFSVCGVAVDQSNGDVYIADNGLGPGVFYRYKLKPTATLPLSDEDYSETHGIVFGTPYCSVAADQGHMYAAGEANGPTKDFEGDAFGTEFLTLVEGTQIDLGGTALSMDPVAHELYVNTGSKINVYSTGPGYPQENEITGGGLNASAGVATNDTNHAVYAVNGNKILEYEYVAPPYHPLDNPAIRHAEHNAVGHYGDFQVTPDGAFGAFSTTMPLLSGYDNAGFQEVYRYDNGSADLTCASCVPTEGQPATDSRLPEHGQGLIADGRVFFNTGEQLVLRDTNENLDAYEWSPQRNVTGGCAAPAGCQQLISSGTSIFDSGMLGVTAGGKDAFFFTREKLVDDDFNGEAMKIYDAREEGGFFKLPQEPPCAAADECRGAGTQAAPPPQIGTFKGTGGQAKAPPKKCGKGRVRKHGKCVKKKRKAKHSKRRKGSSRGGDR